DSEKIKPANGKRQRDVSELGSEEPLEAKGILHPGAAVAVRLVIGVFGRGGSGAQGTLVESVGVRNIEMQGAGHGLELAVSLADFQRIVADAHGDVQDGAFRRTRHIAENLGVKSIFQKLHELVGVAGMKHGLDRGRASGGRSPADGSSDVPLIAKFVPHVGLAVAVVLVYG